MTDRTNITMWFVSVKLFFRHLFFLTFFYIFILERVKESNLTSSLKASVLPLNSPQYPTYRALNIIKFFKFGGGGNSNFRRPKSTGLQPAPFDRFGTPPLKFNVGIPTNLKVFNNKRFISIYQIIAINHFALKYARNLK